MAQNNARNINEPSTLVNLAGDLSGTMGASTVVALQGYPVASGAPSDGYVLTWDGSQWIGKAPPSLGTYYVAPTGAYILPISIISTSQTLSSSASQVYINTGASVTLTLPSPAPIGLMLTVKNRSAGTLNISTTGQIYSPTAIGSGYSMAGSGTPYRNASRAFTCFDGVNWAVETS